MKNLLLPVLAGLVASALATSPAPAQSKKTLAFVTNASADFWTIARRGTEKAEKELPGYKVEFFVPSQSSAAEQKGILDDLLAKGVAGIAISAVDPINSVAELDKVASQAVLFTTDSDAPNSKRVMYVGTDNVAAGVQAGELIKKALPNGGKIMLFVGLKDAANARQRIEGIMKSIAGTKIEVVDVRTDGVDFVRAKSNVEDTLTKYPDIAGLVGLYSYNTPQIYAAVKAAGKAGQVQIIGFDEDQVTLRGIADGAIIGTVVQQPFEFGYQSIKLMAKYIEGDKSVVPADGLDIVPTRIIDKSNVADFQATMKALLAK